MMKEDWAKQGRKNFFKKTIKGGLAEQLLQHNPGMPLPAGLELNPMEESLIQIPLIKGRREKEIQDWLLESNFQRPDILNKFEDEPAEEQDELVYVPVDKPQKEGKDQASNKGGAKKSATATFSQAGLSSNKDKSIKGK